MIEKACCLTGHREIPPEDFAEIARRLEVTLIQLIEKGYLYFGTGGALGFDTLAAQTVLKLQTAYPYIKLILVLPCENQVEYWKQEDKLIYEAIKAKRTKWFILQKPISGDVCISETVILLTIAVVVSAI